MRIQFPSKYNILKISPVEQQVHHFQYFDVNFISLDVVARKLFSSFDVRYLRSFATTQLAHKFL